MSAQHEPTPQTTVDASEAAPDRGTTRAGRTAPRVGEAGRFAFLPSSLPFRDIQLPHALQTGPFRKYWISQLISLAGTWMQNTGSQLVVLSLTSSAVLIGAINVVSALPLLLFSLYGGVIADRLDRRRILIVTQSMLGIISLAYAFLIWQDLIEYWHILVVAGFAGIVMAFELPAAQAFVSELVDRDDLPQALALNSASFNATRTIGPAFAGIVIGAFGTAVAFVINALTLLAPISVLFGLRKVIKPPVRSASRISGLAALKVGMNHIRTHDDLLGLVYLSALFSFLVFPNLLVLMPLYVTDGLGGSDSWVAIMISILGVGSLTGSITMLRGSRLEAAAGKRLRVAMAGLALGLIWLALAPNPWWAIPGIMVAGFSFTTGNTQIMTRLQQLAPHEMRGRVMSVNSLAFNGVMPFATMAIAGVSELIGQHIVIGICAVLVGIGSLLLWRRYVWQAFDTPPPVAEPVPAA
jgi:MFS family permease